MGHEVSCLELGSAPKDARARASSLWAAGTRRFALSLDPDDCMTVLAVLALPAQAESAALVSMPIGGATGARALFLCIGLTNGTCCARGLSPAQASSPTRGRVSLGPRRPSSSGCRSVARRACSRSRLARGPRTTTSSRWSARRSRTRPSSTAAPLLRSPAFAEGIVAIAGNTLRILSLDRLGDAFHSEALPLRYTPRRMGVHSISGNLVIIESDHNAYNEEEKAQLYEAAGVTPPLPAGTPVPEDEEAEGIVMEQSIGVPRAQPGKWASCVRVVDPVTRTTLSVIELADNEAAVSVAMVPLRDRAGETFVFVGTVRDMTLKPRALAAAYIHCYQFTDGNRSLELVHKTQVEDVPKALVGFGGRLLAGIGNRVRLYDMGKKKLLRKCELKGLPTLVHSIHVISPSRLVVGDLAESFHYVKYQKAENTFVLFADDVAPRWLTASCALDANTVAGADKFGNIFVTRLPQDVSDDVDDAQLLSRGAGNEALMLNGAPSKSDELVQYHVGETVTSLQKVTLGPGCAEVILYTTIMGGVGALLPITSKDDLELLQALEMHLRQEAPPLSGRDQLFFRSAYFPVKAVVDGDFCAGFNALPAEEQRSIAEDLDRSPADIAKKLEELLNRVQ